MSMNLALILMINFNMLVRHTIPCINLVNWSNDHPLRAFCIHWVCSSWIIAFPGQLM